MQHAYYVRGLSQYSEKHVTCMTMPNNDEVSRLPLSYRLINEAVALS